MIDLHCRKCDAESHDCVAEPDAVPADRYDMAFLGTTITDGRGRILVTSIRAGTDVGKIGSLIDEAMTRAPPLEGKLSRLGHVLVALVLSLCCFIVVAGWLRGV